jgi:hypothetical protein
VSVFHQCVLAPGSSSAALYDASMDSRQLKKEQAENLREMVRRDLHVLNALCRRMELRGFPADDKLYAAAMNARHAVQGLFVECHYAGCSGGVGR